MESRLENIEAKLSLAEDMLDELNNTVYHQQRRIDRLEQELATLREQVRESLSADPRDPDGEVPPHY